MGQVVRRLEFKYGCKSNALHFSASFDKHVTTPVIYHNCIPGVLETSKAYSVLAYSFIERKIHKGTCYQLRIICCPMLFQVKL